MAVIDVTLRVGSVADLDAIMQLFDEAVIWLVAQGREAQWGSEPWSADERKVAFIRTMLESGITTIAEVDGKIVGAANHAREKIAYAPAVDEPEIYIHLLITSPTLRGGGIGSRLLEAVRADANAQGIPLLRVDCWAVGDRKLVGYYVNQGFTPVVEVPVRDTAVQVFEQRLDLGAATQ